MEFERAEQAEKAIDGVGGRKYSGRTVIASYFNHEKFTDRKFND